MSSKWDYKQNYCPETEPSVLEVDGTMTRLLAVLAAEGWTLVLATRVQYWSKASHRWLIDYKKILCVITSNRSDDDISLVRIYDSHLKTIHWELNLNELDVHYHTRSTLFHVFTAEPDGRQTGIRFGNPIEANDFKLLVLEASVKRMEQLSRWTTLTNLSSRKVINKSLNSSTDQLSSSKPSPDKLSPHESMAANIPMANSKVTSKVVNNGGHRSQTMAGSYRPPLIGPSHKISGERHQPMNVTANSGQKFKFDATDSNPNHTNAYLPSYPALNDTLNDGLNRLSQGVRHMDTALNQLISNIQTIEYMMSTETKIIPIDRSLDVIHESDEEIMTSETPIQTSIDISLNTTNDKTGQGLNDPSFTITSFKGIDMTPNQESVDEIDVMANQSQSQTQVQVNPNTPDKSVQHLSVRKIVDQLEGKGLANADKLLDTTDISLSLKSMAKYNFLMNKSCNQVLNDVKPIQFGSTKSDINYQQIVNYCSIDRKPVPQVIEEQITEDIANDCGIDNKTLDDKLDYPLNAGVKIIENYLVKEVKDQPVIISVIRKPVDISLKEKSNEVPKSVVDIDEDIVDDNSPTNGEKMTHLDECKKYFDEDVSKDNDNKDNIKAINEDPGVIDTDEEDDEDVDQMEDTGNQVMNTENELKVSKSDPMDKNSPKKSMTHLDAIEKYIDDEDNDNEDKVKAVTEDLDVKDTEEEGKDQDQEEDNKEVKEDVNEDVNENVKVEVEVVIDIENQVKDNENELKVSKSNPMAKHSPKKSNKMVKLLRGLCFGSKTLSMTSVNQTDVIEENDENNVIIENNENETNDDQSIDNCQQLVDEIQSEMFDFPKQLITKCDEIKPLAANSPDKDFQVFVNCINEMSTKYEDFIANQTLEVNDQLMIKSLFSGKSKPLNGVYQPFKWDNHNSI